VIIDAHHHLWDPATRRHAWLDALPALRRRFDLDDYRRAAAPLGVTSSVLVQVLPDISETEEFLAIAAASAAAASANPASRPGHAAGPASRPGDTPGPGDAPAPGPGDAQGPGDAPGDAQGPGDAPGYALGARGPEPAPRVAAVVGWVELPAPDVGAQIARLRQRPGGDRLAGVRHLVQDEPDPDWLDRVEVRRGLRAAGESGLVCDLLIRPAQLPAALRVTSDLDSVAFVLDHAAKPRIATGQLQPWATLIAELGRRPNVTCKVSGLVTEAAAGWQPDQFARYAEVIVASFGPRRLMFGSDWPVCTLAASYGEVVGLARDLLSRQLSPAECDAVFAGTARSVYGVRPFS
jgi:L-fuconolactonase